MGGYSTLRATPRGEMSKILKAHTLKDAIKIAESTGLIAHKNRVHNLVTSSGVYLMQDMLMCVEGTGWKYHAIGTGTTTPGLTDIKLTTEVARKTIDTIERDPIVGWSVIVASIFYIASQCTYNIKEAGVFGGYAASAVADSGAMFCHFLQNYDNSAGNYDLTFEYSLRIFDNTSNPIDWPT